MKRTLSIRYLMLIGLAALMTGCAGLKPSDRYSGLERGKSDRWFEQTKKAITVAPELRLSLGIAGPLHAHEREKLARKDVAAGDLMTGRLNLERGRQFDPTYEVLLASIDRVDAKIQKEEERLLDQQRAQWKRAQKLVAQAVAAAKKGERYNAYYYANKALRVAPSSQGIAQLEKSFRGPAAEELTETAQALLKKGEAIEAYDKIELAFLIYPSAVGLPAVRAEVSEKLAARLLADGKKAEAASLPSLAGLRYRQAEWIYPEVAGLDAALERAGALEAKALKYTIVVSSIKLRGKQAKAIRAAFDQTLDEVRENPNIELITPEEFRRTKAARRGTPYGWLTVTFKGGATVDLPVVTYQEQKEVIEYRSEIRYFDVSAPQNLEDYFVPGQDFGYGRRRGILREMEKRRSDADPTNDLMPIFVPVPYTTYQPYRVWQYRRHAELRIDLALADGPRRTLLAQDTVIGSQTVTDQVVRANARLDIDADPKELPSKAEVGEMALDSMIEQLEPALRTVTAAYAERLLKQAQALEKAGKSEAALNGYILYAEALYAAGLNVAPIIDEKIAAATGFFYSKNSTTPFDLVESLKK